MQEAFNSGFQFSLVAFSSIFFLVDPLDGTKAFVRGDPHFTVNIALVEGGRPVAGAVVAPPSGEVWFTRDGAAVNDCLLDEEFDVH